MRRGRVLVVAEDPQVRELLEGACRDRGHAVRTTAAEDEARRIAVRERPSASLVTATLKGQLATNLVSFLRWVHGGDEVLVIVGDEDPSHVQALVDAGATLLLRQPLDPARAVDLVDAALARSDRAHRPAGGVLTALVYEPDVEARATLSDLLGGLGVTTRQAATDESAREIAADQPIDMVVLDLSPGPNFGTARALATDVRRDKPELPVLAVVPPSPAGAERALEAGATHLVYSPATADGFARALTAAAQPRRMLSEALELEREAVRLRKLLETERGAHQDALGQLASARERIKADEMAAEALRLEMENQLAGALTRTDTLRRKLEGQLEEARELLERSTEESRTRIAATEAGAKAAVERARSEAQMAIAWAANEREAERAQWVVQAKEVEAKIAERLADIDRIAEVRLQEISAHRADVEREKAALQADREAERAAFYRRHEALARELHEQLSASAAELETARAARATAMEQVTDIEAKAAKHLAEMSAEWTGRVQKLEQERDGLDEARRALQDALAKQMQVSQDRERSLTEQLEIATEDRDRFLIERNTAQADLTALRADLEAREAALREDLGKRLADAHRRIEEIVEDNAGLEWELAAMHRTREAFQTEALSHVRQELDAAEARAAVANDQVARLEAEIAQLKKEDRERHASMVKVRGDERRAREILTDKLEKAQSLAQTLETELERRTAEFQQELEVHKKTARTEVASLTAEVDKTRMLESKLQAIEAELSAARVAAAGARNQLDTVTADLAAAREALARDRVRLAELEPAAKSALDDRAQLEAQLEILTRAAQDSRARAEAELAKREAEHEARLTELEAAVTAAAEASEAAAQQAASLRATIAEQEAQIVKLRRERDAAVNSAADHEERKSQRTSELEAENAELVARVAELEAHLESVEASTSTRIATLETQLEAVSASEATLRNRPVPEAAPDGDQAARIATLEAALQAAEEQARARETELRRTFQEQSARVAAEVRASAEERLAKQREIDQAKIKKAFEATLKLKLVALTTRQQELTEERDRLTAEQARLTAELAAARAASLGAGDSLAPRAVGDPTLPFASLDTLPCGVVVFDAQLSILHANPLAARSLALRPGTRAAQPEAVIDPELSISGTWAPGRSASSMERSVFPFRAALTQALAGGKESPYQELDLSEGAAGLFLRYTVRRLPDSAAPAALVLILEDDTERRRLSNYARQADQLAAFSLISTGLLPDVTNPLATAMRQVEQLSGAVPDNPELHATVVNIQASIARAAATAGTLETLCATPLGAATFGDPRVAFDRVLSMLETKLASGKHTLTWDRDSRHRPVSMDQTELERLMLSLFLFACDTMPGGGSIQVSAADVAEMVEIRVRTGSAALVETELPQLLDPFGKSTAVKIHRLGPAIAKHMVEQAGGSIGIDLHPESGAVIRLKLPAVVAPPARKERATGKVKLPRGVQVTPPPVRDGPKIGAADVVAVASPGKLREALLNAFEGEASQLRVYETIDAALAQMSHDKPQVLVVDPALVLPAEVEACQNAFAAGLVPALVILNTVEDLWIVNLPGLPPHKVIPGDFFPEGLRAAIDSVEREASFRRAG